MHTSARRGAARKIAARGKWRVLNTLGVLATIIQTVRPTRARGITYQRSMCLRYGAAQPLRSNLFRSFPASRYRTVAERVMDVEASLLRRTYETRGAPLRSSASDVGHFIYPAPSPSLSALASFGGWILNNAHQFTIDTAYPFELVPCARGGG